MTLFMLCLKVFFIRIIDVSLGTVRTIIIVKDKRFVASLIGFFEMLIWFLVAKEAINTNNNSILIAIFYSLGFATGTYVGAYLSDRYVKGNFWVQVISDKKDLIKVVRNNGYVVSELSIKGYLNKERYMLFIQIDKQKYSKLQKIIKEYDEKAFIVVNETKYVQNYVRK